jgi:hypothetical protein
VHKRLQVPWTAPCVRLWPALRCWRIAASTTLGNARRPEEIALSWLQVRTSLLSKACLTTAATGGVWRDRGTKTDGSSGFTDRRFQRVRFPVPKQATLGVISRPWPQRGRPAPADLVSHVSELA